MTDPTAPTTPEAIAHAFERHRSHLRAVAYRMLGSRTEADDAVQEAWLRVGRADTDAVENLGGWLTTIVARVSLDMLRSRRARHAEPVDAALPMEGLDPEHEALLADAVGPALLVVLETLAPAERLAFVLHDLFAVPFEDVAQVLGRSEAAVRQLASRARRRVQGKALDETDRSRERAVVDAFLAASRKGDFEALLAVLDPDVIVRADGAAVTLGSSPEIRGADAVAKTFLGRAAAARGAWLDGMASAAWAPGGKPRVVFEFTFANDCIVGLRLIGDPAVHAEMHLELLGG